MSSCPTAGPGGLEHLVQTIGQWVGAYLALESTDASTMDDLLGHSISYQIAVGPHAGRKAFTLQ